jgi:FixJ family two-component response regulator
LEDFAKLNAVYASITSISDAPEIVLLHSFGVRGALMLETVPIVFILDDDISVRDSLEGLIRHHGWQPETFATAQEFLKRMRGPEPCCLILDIFLPDINGLDLQTRIADDRIDMPIIFVTGANDIPMTVRAMKAGAVEFLTKPFSDEPLLNAVRGALDRSRARLSLDDELRDLRDRFAALSRREREVLLLVISGRLNKQVGAELGISEITVKAHRGRMMQKMGARTFADLMKMALKLGITLRNSSQQEICM